MAKKEQKATLAVTQSTQTTLQITEALGKRIRNGEISVHDAGKELGLNIKQIQFCMHYTDREFLGNGTLAYLNTYYSGDKKFYDTAKVQAYQALGRPKVTAFINCLLEADGFTDEFMDKQLLFVATQNQDLHAKVASIKLYADLKNRIRKTLELNVREEFDYSKLTTEELEALAILTDKARR